MIKVVIADDEKRFRLYMEKVLDWEALGFTICGIASNGEQVLKIVLETKPDIALLDINMPKMDGLVLTEKLKTISPDTYVVFITGYSEFEYARKALKLGVCEYLLKPFSKEELGKVMMKLKETILKKKEEEKQNLYHRKVTLEEMLNKTMQLEAEDREELLEYRERLMQLGISLDAPYYEVSITELEKLGEKEIPKEDRRLWLFGIRNILEELGEREGKDQILFQNYEGHLVSLWKLKSREELKELPDLLKKFCSLTESLLGISVTVGVGSPAAEFYAIPSSYNKAMLALQNKFVFGTSRVISYEEAENRNQKADFYRLELNERLLGYLRKNDREKVEDTLALVKQEMVEQQYSADYANAAIMGILSVCLSYIVEMKGDIGEILGEHFSPYQSLGNMHSLEESFQWLSKIFRTTTDYFRKPHSKRAEQIIEDVEGYIREHYSDFELTAGSVSEAVFLDISYIRKIFAKYRGCTIQDYIITVRMQAAKEKMEQQKYSVSEIAEACGYLDAGYFSKCFKKYYQVSPRQYVNQLQNGKNQE